MSEQPKEFPPETAPAPVERRGIMGLFWPILLIAVGAAFLLNNMGLLNFDWGEVARYWPVVLILIGLDILVGRRSMAASVAVAVVAVVLIGGAFGLAALSGAATGRPGEQINQTFEEELDGVEALEVTVDLDIMQLEIGAQPGGELAAQGNYVADSRIEPRIEYMTRGDTGVLTITQPPLSGRLDLSGRIGDNNRMSLNLPQDVPIDLTVISDLGEVNLHVSELDVRSLTVDANAGAVTVNLPLDGELSKVEIDSDLGEVVVLAAPDSSRLSIETLDIDSNSGRVSITLPREGTIGEFIVDSDLGEVQITSPATSNVDIGSLTVDSNSGRVTLTLPAAGEIGAIGIEADLGEVRIEGPGGPSGVLLGSLTITSNSGAVTVTLPFLGDYPVSIDADLGAVTVHVPDGLEARVTIDADMAEPSVGSRFQPAGADTWETDGYSDAAARATITIITNMGGVTVD